jgi:chromosome segregation ATPase
VSHLKPHFESRGYRCDAFGTGGEAMVALEAKSRDLVVLEVNLGDQSAAEFVDRARASEPHAAYLLLDDATRAGQIVKAVQAGVIGFLPTPPNEVQLFKNVERLVVAARGMSGRLEGGYSMQVEALEQELDRARTDSVESAMQTDLLQQEAEELNKKLAELEGRPSQEDLDEVKKSVEELGEERDHLQKRVDELTTQGLEQVGVQSDLDDAKAQLDKLQGTADELNGLQEHTAELETKVSELGDELRQMTERAETAETKVRALEEQRDERQVRVDQLEAELEEVSERAKKLEADLEEIGDAATTLKSTRQELEETSARAQTLAKEREELENRALDLELQVEELEEKQKFMGDEVKAAEARAAEAEAHFKKEKLRLIEEKQDAAAGSHEAFAKMEKMLNELAALKSAKAEAEAQLAALRAGDPASAGE